MKRRSLLVPLVALQLGGFFLACSSSDSTTNTTTPGAGGTNTGNGGTQAGGGIANGQAGTANAGTAPTGGVVGNGGAVGNAGNNGTAGTAPGGAGGAVPQGGAGGDVGVGGAAGDNAGGTAGTGGVGADDECVGNPPPAPIADLITAAPDRYTFNIGGHPFAVDLTAPIIMGKLVVDMGVSSGGIFGFAVDRGMHTYGGEIQPQCELSYDPEPSQHNGDCRLNRVDGLPYGDQNTDNEASSLFGNLKAGLQELAVSAPGQGWEYFLDSEGELRLQDIGFTGYSHGAQTAARIGVAYCVWRAVSRSGPRDNECGNGTVAGNWESGNLFGGEPAYDDNCTRYSTWIMDPPASPMSHFYSFGGKTDGQFGDFQWTLDHLGGGFIGDPVNISTTPPGDSHRFYADDGHGGFDGEEYWEAQGKAWNVPEANMVHAAQ
ncbi:MAG TPA: hypothetical protein VHO25_09335 [Polyangiaceae bacterium]|nr:hypothetical protein [Polyangiaceae bacterium]